ncbi:MAG: DUF58 domain-containing protein [Frankiales bacterium]|nr:DUF58 domain-containing protein [Frankiales bacterium]
MPATPLAPAASVRRLSLQVAHRLDGLLQGDHLGYLPGPGTEPAEARAYAPGDDVRRIDWAVTARTGEPHVRQAVAERELETTLLVDLTASMSFGTARSEKREVAVALAAAVGHLASGPGDRLGAVVLGEGVRRLPARSGRLAALALLHVLQTTRPGDGAGPSLQAGLEALVSPPRRRGLVVVVSDLQSAGHVTGLDLPWARPLRQLAQRHDVVVVEVVDPRELELPAAGVMRLADPESGRHLEVQTGDRRLRERYAAAAAARRSGHAEAIRSAGAGHLLLRTDRDWLPPLAGFLAARRRLRAAGRSPGSR